MPVRLLALAAVLGVVFHGRAQGETVVFSDDFEHGDLAGWTSIPPGDWTNTTSMPVTGLRSVRHNRPGVSGRSAMAVGTGLILESDYTVWRFNLMNGNWDPSTQNRFWFYLAADTGDLAGSSADGYAVGVNLDGSSDRITLWRVAGGAAAAAIAESTFDWNENTLAGIEVTRSLEGRWQLAVDADGGFDGLVWSGTGTDAVHSNAAYCGLVLDYTSTRGATKLWMDDVSIVQGGAPSNRPPSLMSVPADTNRRVLLNSEVTLTVTATEPLADLDEVMVLSASNLPPDAVFNAVTGVCPLSAEFRWIPTEAGRRTLTFLASDKDGTSRLDVAVSVAVALSGSLWINEIHYDNVGTDVNEGVEIAGKGGTDLSLFRLVRYEGDTDGKHGTVDGIVALSNRIDREDGYYGAVWFPMGLEQGPDGLALVAVEGDESNVVQFLSYEGVIAAVDGPAKGMRSAELGVVEVDTTPVGLSLQLRGRGRTSSDFIWSGPTNESPGTLNQGQTIEREATLFYMR